MTNCLTVEIKCWIIQLIFECIQPIRIVWNSSYTYFKFSNGRNYMVASSSLPDFTHVGGRKISQRRTKLIFGPQRRSCRRCSCRIQGVPLTNVRIFPIPFCGKVCAISICSDYLIWILCIYIYFYTFSFTYIFIPSPLVKNYINLKLCKWMFI